MTHPRITYEPPVFHDHLAHPTHTHSLGLRPLHDTNNQYHFRIKVPSLRQGAYKGPKNYQSPYLERWTVSTVHIQLWLGKCVICHQKT